VAAAYDTDLVRLGGWVPVHLPSSFPTFRMHNRKQNRSIFSMPVFIHSSYCTAVCAARYIYLGVQRLYPQVDREQCDSNESGKNRLVSSVNDDSRQRKHTMQEVSSVYSKYAGIDVY
jgi:hypothetical protein